MKTILLPIILLLGLVMSGCAGRCPSEGIIVSKHFTPAQCKQITIVEYQKLGGHDAYLPFYRREIQYTPDTYAISYRGGSRTGKIEVSKSRYDELHEGQYMIIRRIGQKREILTRN